MRADVEHSKSVQACLDECLAISSSVLSENGRKLSAEENRNARSVREISDAGRSSGSGSAQHSRRSTTNDLIVSLDLDQSRLIVPEPFQRFRIYSVDWFRCID